VQIPIDEVRCGPELRPVESLASFAGGSVSFELVAVGTTPPPQQTPMWTAGPTITGRDLDIPARP
jgi:hypothetical protein